MTSPELLSPAVSELRERLGAQTIQLPVDYGGRKFADWSRTPSAEPIAFARPHSTAEVSEILSICHKHGQAVVTQGGLSGLAGGACLLGGEIALSLERMNGIEAIDKVSSTMTALAGTPLQIVQERAADEGFFFPLDLGARGSCTIGGNMATNAGGNRVIKYGMMRDQVLDIEAVLADGSIVGSLLAMMKNNTGYDLRHLLIGSEGTLGVITKAVLRLRPKPNAVSTAWCGLPSYEAVTTLLTKAQSGLPAGVSAFEVMWPSYYDFVLDKLPELRRPLVEEHAFYVLLESSGADPVRQAESFEAFLGEMLVEGIVADAALAASESDALAFWAIRDAPGEYPRLLPGRTSFDISFSVSKVGEAATRCDRALRARWPEATVLIYGHLGDGNIHIVVHMQEMPPEKVKAIQAVVYEITGELHGSVSAEHGIGIKKLGAIGKTRTPAELSAMRAIKAALDSKNILNPGKVLG
jgi:FAD/FMN-containing dehydrogenase